MPVQNSVDVDTRQFILESYNSTRKDKAVIFTDAGRATPLLSKTLMSKIAATGKFVPFTDEAAIDGTGIPAGVFDPEGNFGDIPTADIVAGDVVDVPILEFGASFDKAQLVIENGKLLTTVIADGIQTMTVEDALRRITLIAEDAIAGSRSENS